MNKNKKIGIGIIILVIIVIAVVIYQKNNAFVTYSDPSGLYSFDHSPSWKVEGGGNGTIPAASKITLPEKDKVSGQNDQVIIFLDINDALLASTVAQFPTKKEAMGTIDGYMADKYTSTATSGPALPTVYALHLKEATSTKISLVAYSTNRDITPLLKTLKVNKGLIEPTAEKVNAVLSAAIDNARTKEADARIKAGLANLRIEAEEYYDKNSSSYAGLCTKDLKVKPLLNAVIGIPTSCKDSAKAYAAASTLITSGFFCVDSTGYAGEVKALNRGTVCEK